MIKNLLFASLFFAFAATSFGQQGTCASPIVLTCGQTTTGNTASYQNSIENYGLACSFSAKEGAEIVYQITPPNNCNLTAAVTNVVGDDLKVVFLNTCNPVDCISMSDDNPISKNESETISAVGGTTYYVIVDGNDSGDVASFDLEITCNQTTNVIETLEEQISLYPNPSQDIINVKGVNFNNAEVNIIDASGRNVTAQTTLNQTTIDVSNLTSGSYILSVNLNGETANKRFSIQ